MTKKMRFALFTAILVLLMASTVSAFALGITVSNNSGLGSPANVAFVYTDASTGTQTAKAWFKVPVGEVRSFELNADSDKPIYYAAYNKVQFLDSATRGEKPIVRWASPHNFTFTGDYEPDADGAWQAKFYPVGSSNTVNLNYTR
ncbi:MAG: hypothetical protein LBS93_05060 [Synergistaceae bacterium]|nr:hypothetical protein [Synergistaceae bacterium]